MLNLSAKSVSCFEKIFCTSDVLCQMHGKSIASCHVCIYLKPLPIKWVITLNRIRHVILLLAGFITSDVQNIFLFSRGLVLKL